MSKNHNGNGQSRLPQAPIAMPPRAVVSKLAAQVESKLPEQFNAGTFGIEEVAVEAPVPARIVPVPVHFANTPLRSDPIKLSVTLVGNEAMALRRLFNGLHDHHTKMNNGEHIDKPLHVVRYLMQVMHENWKTIDAK